MGFLIGNLIGEPGSCCHVLFLFFHSRASSMTRADGGSVSALGVHDGKVYEALWERAQKEPLNATEVPDGYEVRLVLLWQKVGRY